MNNRIKYKLSSGKGASITYGLLLFLICAMASSVIIVASTSTAGRLSGLAESEQGYYAVTSVAKMIEQELDDRSSAVIKVGDSKYFVSKDNTSAGKTPATLADYIASELSDLNGAGAINLTIKPAAANEALSKVLDTVTVTAKADANSNLVLEIKSITDEETADVVTMDFSTEKKETDIEVEQNPGTRIEYSWDLDTIRSGTGGD